MANFWDIGTNLGLNPNSVVGQALNLSGGGLLGRAVDQATSAQSPSVNMPSDQQYKDQVKNNQIASLKTPEQHAQDIMQGTGAAGAIANQGANLQNEQQSLGGGGIPGMSQAISNKAAKNFEKQQGRLQQQANFQGMQSTMHNVNTATANAIALANAQRGVDNAMANIQMQADQARFSVISGLMSGAGSMAGMYMGSRSSSAPSAGGYSQSQMNSWSDPSNMQVFGSQADFTPSNNMMQG